MPLSARWSPKQRRQVGYLLAVPIVLEVALVWIPVVATVILAFASWSGVSLHTLHWVGLENFKQIFTIYPPFYPALLHNLYWLLAFLLVVAPSGIGLAVLLDRKIRGSRVYQSAIYLPVVLSLAIVGFIWQLIYAQYGGLLNGVLGQNGQIGWLAEPSLNIWAVIVAACWREVGFVMVLYLAGLKTVDESLKDAARIDGASERAVFRYVIFPVLQPINVMIAVILVIDSLKAFDLVYIINQGTNGLEMLAALVASNIIGVGALIGYGSAIATVLLGLSACFIVVYVRQMRRSVED